jgi:hypothetical protein
MLKHAFRCLVLLLAAQSAGADEVRLHIGGAVGLSLGRVRSEADGFGRYWSDERTVSGSYRGLLGVDRGLWVVRFEPAFVSVAAPAESRSGPQGKGFRMEYLEFPVTVGFRLGGQRSRTLGVIFAAGVVYARRVGLAFGDDYVTSTRSGRGVLFGEAHAKALSLNDPGLRATLIIERGTGRFAPLIGASYTSGLRDLDPDPKHRVYTTRFEVHVGAVVRRAHGS